MRLQVDIQRSIDTGRLCTVRRDIQQWLNAIVYVLLAVAFLAMGLVFPIAWLQQNPTTNSAALMFFLLCFLFGIFAAYGIITENKLTRIDGKDLETNRRVMLSILSAEYNTKLIYEGELMLSYYKRGTFIKFSHRVIVLFDNGDVLINIARFNPYDIKSFFHPFFSKMKIRSMANKFNKEAWNVPR